MKWFVRDNENALIGMNKDLKTMAKKETKQETMETTEKRRTRVVIKWEDNYEKVVIACLNVISLIKDVEKSELCRRKYVELMVALANLIKSKDVKGAVNACDNFGLALIVSGIDAAEVTTICNTFIDMFR